MIINIIAALFCGQSFYSLAKRHGKSEVLFFIVGIFCYLFLHYLILNLLTLIIVLESNITNLVSLVSAATACYFLLLAQNKSWSQTKNRSDILDDDL